MICVCPLLCWSLLRHRCRQLGELCGVRSAKRLRSPRPSASTDHHTAAGRWPEATDGDRCAASLASVRLRSLRFSFAPGDHPRKSSLAVLTRLTPRLGLLRSAFGQVNSLARSFLISTRDPAWPSRPAPFFPPSREARVRHERPDPCLAQESLRRHRVVPDARAARRGVGRT